ncbi:MAG: hypothetical protein A2176_10620 [Spirochaetes bacterium RBG_13_51_14]|nr:MAG: hypothetical protein A2176_10620 [Spirochaetes bacterium RBG_13_51_14]
MAAMIKKNRFGAFILIPVLIVIGFLIGRVLGDRFIENIVLKQSRLPLLLSSPVVQFYDVYTLINSNNPYSRLSGYYSLLDNKMINEAYLMERYRQERIVVIKRTLLWCLSFSKDTGAVLEFYSSIYHDGDQSLKVDILGLMKRLDEKYYLDFMKTKRFPGEGSGETPVKR